MGYYSFYKIIQDIIRKIFNVNIWKISLIVIVIFIFVLNFSKVFASYDITIENNTISIPDNFMEHTPYYAFFKYNLNNTTNILVIRSLQPIKYKLLGRYSSSYRYIFGGTGDFSEQTMRALNGGNVSNFNTYINSVNWVDMTVNSSQYEVYWNIDGQDLTPVFSNYDLYDYDSPNTPVFNGTDTSPFTAPFFTNTYDITAGAPDYVFINRGDFSATDTLYFHLLKVINTETENNITTYYYNDKIFSLNNKSKYYTVYDGDTNEEYSYYILPRASLNLDVDSSYLYVLNDANNKINNSQGIIEIDISNGVYDVLSSDTAGVFTVEDSINDKIQDIQSNINENNISNDTEDTILSNLNFNNENSFLNALNFGFFSRLTALVNSISDYNLSEISEINIPLPFFERTDINQEVMKTLTIKSDLVSSHLSVAHGGQVWDFSVIINAFWYFIFTFYVWRFVNKLYITVASGKILDNFSSSDEVITNNML